MDEYARTARSPVGQTSNRPRLKEHEHLRCRLPTPRTWHKCSVSALSLSASSVERLEYTGLRTLDQIRYGERLARRQPALRS